MRIAKWFIVGMAVLVVGLSAIIAGVGLDSRATLAAPPAQASPPGAWAQYCSQAQPGTVQVVFLWTPSRQGQQWLDLSVFNNGFTPGTVVGVGPLSPDAWAFVWDGLQPGVTHYVRVNTLTPWGWQPSATAAFTTGYCGTVPPAPAVAYCPRDGVMAWADQLLPLINEGKGILDTATLATQTGSFGTFATLRDQAASLRWRVAALYAPPCAMALQNTIVGAYDYLWAGLNAAADGNYTLAAAYIQQVGTIFLTTAPAQLAQLEREAQ